MKKVCLKKTFVFLSITLVLGVVFYNTKDLIFGAPLSISSVKDGGSISDSFLPISGSAKHASSVEINGRTIGIDRNGHFADGALLSPGYNVIEITQKDRFGKEKRKTLHLVAQPSTSVAAQMGIHYQ